ncbi:hypothetical protein AJ80_01448 [Polytolypa hystricis UAMH7299]|uniref:Sensitive to high expression protein 9, mitochondrial n=1 Tax=Polytolypa hystricis (strain UAMH7299) TaxID=1447883 RepID=A0A2B7YYW3_POLH7|nr:hypothetical protein AJ80_01448 [Polytolypa hystricis UAMH7299]
MQSMTLLLRQFVRAGLGSSNLILTRASSTTTTFPPLRPAPRAIAAARSTGGICARCQFRAQTRLYSTHNDGASSSKGGDKNNNIKGAEDSETPISGRGEGKDDAAPAIHLPGPTVAKPEQSETPTTTTTGTVNTEQTKDGNSLPSQAESRRSDVSKQFTRLMDDLQSNIFTAGQRLNELTGYAAIEKLKQDILAQEELVRSNRARVRAAKDAYSSAINRRSASQREVNELLQRKHAWTPTDLERFTSLYRSDHANERAETDAQDSLARAERDAEEAVARLSKNILSRYHEEQIWSDKIRRMSTWGTWGLMGVNVLLFLVFQVAVEPWRRKRLVKGFEEKVMEALEKEQNIQIVAATTTPGAQHVGPAAAAGVPSPPSTPLAAIEPVSAAVTAELSAVEPTAAAAATATPAEDISSPPPPSLQPDSIMPTLTPTPPPPPTTTATTTTTTIAPTTPPPPLLAFDDNDPSSSTSTDSWRQTLHDLFSDRQISLSQRDLTTVALESAAAGAAVMGVLIAIFRPR